ncbi:MAG: response regulator [Deltaproteobacteria bacterium]|nr:response regulator [Deltaproteobacteria bacterium]
MQSAVHMEPHAIATAADLGRARVLLVEDDVTMRTELCRALIEDGHVVETATRGQEALARVERGKWFDVIFCDAQLPDVTAVDFRNRVAEFSLFQASRIVFLAEQAMGPHLNDLVASADNEVMRGPVQVELVRARVRQAISSDE